MVSERCEDAPCCGHGGVCGRAIGMSIASYEDGFDSRTDEEIKQDYYKRMDDELEHIDD